ncbi:thermonuclease family protein [Variovorax sp. PCZ-1]|uniref:thermonuclease family protein n=1 Tax=Variovorax sp. PCZ-1 TaxID=2835533 RepID=UPI001BCB211F|nr:thermonuclease family protein [Variovorax sp. PCZ-1]MBS7806402.1 thermonuclease family protein [Variovorax sp. PCZ-1]
MKIVLISLLLCFTHTAAISKTLQGVVTHVSDGDTLWIKVDPAAKPIKVRLQGMDAPEICQAWGTQARDALRAKILKQSVSLSTRAKDDYKRVLGRVQFKAEDVGAWLVKNGHAWSDHHRRHLRPYANEEAAARKARLGLWAQAGAQEPRQFRKLHGSCHK